MKRYAAPLLIMAVLFTIGVHTARPAFAVSYEPGWNLVAGPSGSTLTGAVGSLYTLQTGDAAYETMPASNPLIACRGYWAYFPSGGAISLTATSYPCPLTLVGQWLMVGNPSATDTGFVFGTTSLLTYSPSHGYQAATGLAVGQGAWALGNGVAGVTYAAPSAAVPTAARVAVPASQPLTQGQAQAVVKSVPLPGGIAAPTLIDVIIDSGSFAFIPLHVGEFLDVPSSTTWGLLPDATKLGYIRSVISALHAAYPSLGSIYFVVWNDWETDFLPSSIPLEWVDPCPVGNRRLFCTTFPDLTARFTTDRGYEYQHVYESDRDTWHAL